MDDEEEEVKKEEEEEEDGRLCCLWHLILSSNISTAFLLPALAAIERQVSSSWVS
jgi:hypothetical protein